MRRKIHLHTWQKMPCADANKMSRIAVYRLQIYPCIDALANHKNNTPTTLMHIRHLYTANLDTCTHDKGIMNIQIILMS